MSNGNSVLRSSFRDKIKRDAHLHASLRRRLEPLGNALIVKPAEAVKADGFDFKVWAVMEDGEVAQPSMVHWRDICSGKLLSHRVDSTENTELYLSSFGDLLRRYGLPKHVYFENTRAAANMAMTGGVPNRCRFKVKEAKENKSSSVLALLGVAVHWAGPGHGQSKPIERLHRDLRSDIEKHPALAGAFSKAGAVPIAKLREVVAACIEEQNARPGAARISSAARRAPCPPEALAIIKFDYLRKERPTFSSCYRRLCAAAKTHQWSIPSERSLMRWIERDVSPAVIALARGQLSIKKF